MIKEERNIRNTKTPDCDTRFQLSFGPQFAAQTPTGALVCHEAELDDEAPSVTSSFFIISASLKFTRSINEGSLFS